MKKSFFLVFFLACTTFLLSYEQWRVMGPNHETKHSSSLPPFQKWHKTVIGYSIQTAPADLGSLIDNAFDTWENYNDVSFQSGNDIIVDVIDDIPGEPHGFFAYVPQKTINSTTAEINGAQIIFNIGNYLHPIYGEKPIVWTDGTELVKWDSTLYICDVQNCATHEVGHTLGIDEHATGAGCPTMALR